MHHICGNYLLEHMQICAKIMTTSVSNNVLFITYYMLLLKMTMACVPVLWWIDINLVATK